MCVAWDTFERECTEKGRAEGRHEGVLSTLTGLVREGILSAQDAANRVSMPLEEFEQLLTFERIGRYDVCPEGTYKVALVAGSDDGGNLDYHWYRQDVNGLWSHKAGFSPLSNVDASGNLIFDPLMANRNNTSSGGANYSYFLGYYAVSPWNELVDLNEDFLYQWYDWFGQPRVITADEYLQWYMGIFGPLDWYEA